MSRVKLETLRQLAEQHVLRHVKGFHLWAACTLCAVSLLFSLSHKLMLSVRLEEKQAMDKGQRVVYHLSSGEMDGTPRHTKQESAGQESREGEGGTGEAGVTGKEALAPAPLDTLAEQTDKGIIPAVGHDGTQAWKYYARPYTPKESRPMVAILVTNLGLSRPLTEDVLKLPHEVTLSFSPYASDAKNWARRARSEGFESLMDMPLEPANYPISDPGPYGLLSSLDANEISSRAHWVMSRYPGYVGVLGSANEKLTANLSVMRTLLTELTARGVFFIYLKTPQNVELANLIKNQKLLAFSADAVIDDTLAPAAITQQLNALAELAKTQGYAIGIAHSYPPTTRAIIQWEEGLQARGVDMVPVSAIARKVFP